MKRKVTIKRATKEDALVVLDNLRPVDEVETYMMTKKSPREAIGELLDSGKEFFIGYVEDQPGALFGLTPFPGNDTIGVPWMIGTPMVEREARHWMPKAKQWIEKANTKYPALSNVVLKQNAHAIRWLKKMGFEFIEADIPGLPGFIQFVRYKECA